MRIWVQLGTELHPYLRSYWQLIAARNGVVIFFFFTWLVDRAPEEGHTFKSNWATPTTIDGFCFGFVLNDTLLSIEGKGNMDWGGVCIDSEYEHNKLYEILKKQIQK